MSYIDFFHEVGKLKRLKRTGWVREGIPDVESVAEHTYRVSVMAMILGKNLDMEKLLKMALIHDLAEGTVGDLVIERGLKKDSEAKDKKEKLEKETMKNLCSKIKREDLFELFLEYENQKSEEAIFLKDMDKLEMALQAYEYEKAHKKNLGEFFKNVKERLKDQELIKLFDEIILKRK